MLGNLVQRAWRDVNAVARHVSLNWDAVGTMYGQHAFRLEPRGQYWLATPMALPLVDTDAHAAAHVIEEEP